MRIPGSVYALLAMTVFSVQDAITKVLGQTYSPFQITMVRYWAFALFALIWAYKTKGGFRKAIHTDHLRLQIFRSFLLVCQIVVSILCFALVGLTQSQAIFVASPLNVAMLSVPLLGEHVGWRRWLAILIGMCGVILIINPFSVHFSSLVFLPVLFTVFASLYTLFTRLAGRYDSPQVSFFYTGMVGLVITSLIGPFFWRDASLVDWSWLIALCLTSVSGHYCLIRALSLTEAVTVQTIGYSQLVYEGLIGIFLFHEVLTLNMAIGAFIVVTAGCFTIWREHAVSKAKKSEKIAQAAAQIQN